jgi:Uma2 family endonuclease
MLGHVRLSPNRRAEHIMAMPSFVPPPGERSKRRWTIREVRQLIEESPLATPRYELVDGELLVTPSPRWVHQRAVSILLVALSEYLARNPVGRAVPSPFDVELEDESLTQPDVFVVPIAEAKRLVNERRAHALLLACEVLSPSSGRHDRVTKRPVYQRHIPEYWIVDLEARLFERWVPDDVRPEILTQRLEWHPAGASEPFRLDLVKYFAEVFEE